MNKTIPYSGPIHWKISEKRVVAAMHSYYDQKNRSKWAGLPPPPYTIREYIAWWLDETAKKKVKDPTCGRIDHSRGYSWDNIEIQSRSENSRECSLRHKKGSKENRIENRKTVFVFNKLGTELIAKFDSRSDAAEFFNVSIGVVIARIRRGRPARTGSVFNNFILRGEA